MFYLKKIENLSHLIGEQHVNNSYNTKIKTALLVSSVFLLALFLVEVIGGYISNSLALLSDSVHVFSDFLALISSFVAIIISQKQNNLKRTYGYSRIEAIVSFANSIILFLMCFYIVFSAVERMINKEVIKVDTMFFVSVFGLLANIFIAFYVYRSNISHSHDHDHSHDKESKTHSDNKKNNSKNLLMQGVFLHFAYDILGSISAILASGIIYYTNWFIVDPLLSVMLVFILLKSTVTITKNAVLILIESSPKNIDIIMVKNDIESLSKDILNVHHIHVWMLNENDFIATLHIILLDKAEINDTLVKIKNLLSSKYKINHTTIQTELESSSCIDNMISK